MKIFNFIKAENIAEAKALLGYGLNDGQRVMFSTYRKERRKLTPEDRIELDALTFDDYNEEAMRSKKFAFWIVAMRMWQDRPLFFFGGIFLWVMLLLKWCWSVIAYFIA